MALITSDCDETRPRASNGPNHLSARRPYQVRSKRLEQREVLEALSVAGAESGAGMDGEARAAVSVSFSFYNVVVLVVVVVLSFSLVLSFLFELIETRLAAFACFDVFCVGGGHTCTPRYLLA